MLIITYVFEEKTMLRLQDKNQALQECLYLLAFLDEFDDKNDWRIHERSKKYTCPLEIQQLWKRGELMESMDAPKFEYFLRKYEDY